MSIYTQVLILTGAHVITDIVYTKSVKYSNFVVQNVLQNTMLYIVLIIEGLFKNWYKKERKKKKENQNYLKFYDL